MLSSVRVETDPGKFLLFKIAFSKPGKSWIWSRSLEVVENQRLDVGFVATMPDVIMQTARTASCCMQFAILTIVRHIIMMMIIK